MVRRSNKAPVNRTSRSAQAHRFYFVGSIDSEGYTRERREPHKPPEGTILDEVFGGDYIISRGGVPLPYVVNSCEGYTVKRSFDGTRTEARCFPMFELANAVQREDQERKAALEFVCEFGMPNGFKEIELQEFLRLGFRYLNLLGSGGLKTLTLNPPPRVVQHVDAGGHRITEVKTLAGFCLFELAEMVRRGTDFRQCAFCRKWYALERRSGKGRGTSESRELRFCNYGTNCRQKYAARKG